MILLYLNREREFIFRNENVVKFGFSKVMNFQRLAKYPNFSEIYVIYRIDVNNNHVEQNILKIFRQRFIQEIDYGTEYFNGDFRIMDTIITLYLTNNKYTFEKIDLYEIFIQNSIPNKIIYNSENWNVKVYQHIQQVMKEENITSFTSVQEYNQFYKTHFFIKKKVKKVKNVEVKNVEVNNVENNNVENNNVKNTYYICHHCIDYKTTSLQDIKNHMNMKNKCNASSLTSISHERASFLSTNKKFIFTFNISNLLQDDYFYIIKNNNNIANYIYYNYKISVSDNNDYNNINSYDDFSYDNFSYNDFDKIYFNYDIQKYKCNLCLFEYTSKQNMEKHILNIKKCTKKRLLLEIMIKDINTFL